MTELRDMGLFPIGMTLLPGERIPLHLFEPRYRQLFADCTLGDEAFVMVLAGDDERASVGCSARFETLVRRFEDGRINTVVLGIEPVEIVEETSGKEYLTARVRVLADAPSTPDAGVQDEVRALFRDLSSRVTGTPRDMEAHDPIPLSFAIAGTIDLAPEIKQELLELRSEAERLLQVRDILKVAGEGMDHTHIAGERAQRNGKVSHP